MNKFSSYTFDKVISMVEPSLADLGTKYMIQWTFTKSPNHIISTDFTTVEPPQ